MKSRFFLAAVALLLAAAAMANPPRLTFTRTMAPAHDLAPAERLAVIYAIGDNRTIEAFVEHFIDLVSRAGVLPMGNAIDNNTHLFMDERSLRAVRHELHADAYVGVNRFSCSGVEKSAEGSE